MNDSFVSKAELLRRMDRSFQRFDTLLSRMEIYDVEAGGVCGEWSVKDIVAHLIAHEQRALGELRAAKNGDPVPPLPADNDSFNAGAVFACRTMPFDLVRDQWHRSYRRVVEVVEGLDEADFDPQGEIARALDDSIDGALANNTYEHYDAHGAQIAAWLER